MAGGQGTRFWPLSVERQPKQFLSIAGERSMLQETVSRLQPLLRVEDVFVVSSAPYLGEIRRQLPELSPEQVIVEPAARNTAPCIGLAALHLQRHHSGETMVVLPSDHVIRDSEEFHEVLRASEELARDGWLITFGIEPTFPSTGYGYLKRGTDLGPYNGLTAYQVKEFLEKPVRETAEQFLQEGGYYWNSGMFVWQTEAILDGIRNHMPGLHRGLCEINENWTDQAKVDQTFRGFKKISIDFGVMEKADRVATFPCSLGWSDVGSWNALEDFLPNEREGIKARCQIESVNSENCLIFAEKSRLVALVGVQDLVVVDTPNAILVCARDQTEDVKTVVERLRTRGLNKHL